MLKCYAYEQGKSNKDKEYLLKAEDVNQLKRHITVHAKIHLIEGESLEQ